VELLKTNIILLKLTAMRKTTLLVLIILSIGLKTSYCSNYLSVRASSGWQFVDASGNYQQGVYEETGRVVNGFVAVRQNGYWGYMDNSITWRISAQYDVAFPFNGHFALVGKNKKFFLINNKGEEISNKIDHALPLQANYKYAVWVKDQKYGIIDNDGTWVVDPIYESIKYDKQGVFLLREKSDKRHDAYYSLFTPENINIELDTNTSSAWFVGNGCIATVQRTNALNSKLVFYSKTSSKMYEKPIDNASLTDIKFLGNSLFYIPTNSPNNAGSDFIDGNYIYSNGNHSMPNFKGLLLDVNFTKTGIARLRNRYIFIDYMGRIKSNYLFENLIFHKDSPFFITRIDNKWKFVFKGRSDFNPLPDIIESIHPKGLYKQVFLAKTMEAEGYILMDYKGRILNDTGFDHIVSPWNNGFITLSKENKKYILSHRGIIVWNEDSSTAKNISLNINVIHRSNTSASKAVTYSSKSNLSKIVKNVKDTLVLLWGEATLVDNKYNGTKLYLVNTLKNQNIKLETQDRRVKIIMEAKDENDKWKPIQYYPNSWCGNSYFNIEMPASSFFTFNIPLYSGIRKTQMRAKLTLPGQNGSTRSVFSDSIDISVNPGQFWVKQSYMPNGIMDPYYE
jgi:WG repeat protein